MQNIDFLPAEYHQKQVRRQSQPWQAVAAVVIIGLVAVAASTQQSRRRHLQEELSVIAPAYEAAMAERTRLADVQGRLKSGRAGAELYTYLRHPWPRTQLLAALVTSLPAEITLQQVQIVRETPATGTHADPRAAIDKKAEDEKSKQSCPAECDLAKLRARLDRLQTVVILTGTATDSAVLHRYIGELDATDIFDKAELDCFTTTDNDKGHASLQFRAVLAVQPGYGQPGGPTAPDKKDVAADGSPKVAAVPH